jgi:hypothetical protein
MKLVSVLMHLPALTVRLPHGGCAGHSNFGELCIYMFCLYDINVL